ncbi:MAG: PIG-L family deacetylase [Planctomycetes bacterium]|nr:PIG-L family deacetylase [Planctomycetota bacterium]
MRPFVALPALVLAACAGVRSVAPMDVPPERVPVSHVADGARPRVLCVVAHPDDEIAFAGTLYKTATALGGACDLFTITNGEGGFKYATLAETIYGKALTDETVGRRELPEIRKRELAAGCRWLGVRDVWFLREKDHRYTQDVNEVLGPEAVAWNVERVRTQLRVALGRGYDFVLVHLPTADTHAHHKAATIVALETVAEIAPDRRPVVLGARVVSDGDAAPPIPSGLAGWPCSTPDARDGPFVFDRRAKFGHQGKLDYRVVVNWAVAEHKSQGTMQLAMNRGDREEYFVFDATRTAGDTDRAAAWFADLARPQFAVREYGESAGTNAASAK